jgi:hypothetical protein
LTVDGGRLALRIGWNPKLILAPIAPDEFDTGTLGTLVFHRDTDGRILGLSLFAERIRNVTFERTVQ